MEKYYSCRGIAITLSVVVGCLVLSVIIDMAARDRKCGTYRGLECYEDRNACYEDLPCACEGYESDSRGRRKYSAYCKAQEWKLAAAANVVVTIFGILFLSGVLIAIVQCILAACNRCTTTEPVKGQFQPHFLLETTEL